MERKIECILLELGITPDLTGFDYICNAVQIISSSKERMKIVDGVYADVSRNFGATKTGVEKAIRHAFSKINRNSEAYKKYIGIGKKTNSALLYTLAYRLRKD